MITQELIVYMREALKRKMPFESIKSELLRVGWEQNDIIRCYDMVYAELNPSTEATQQVYTPTGTVSPVSSLAQNTFTQLPPESQYVAPSTQSASSVVDRAPKKKGSFIGVFLFISLIVLLGLAGAAYAGVFVSNKMIERSLLKGLSGANTTTSDTALSLTGEVGTFTASIQGLQQRLLDQSKYTIAILGSDNTQHINLELRSLNDMLYIYTNDLPESFWTDFLVYEKQWFRIPFGKNDIQNLSSDSSALPVTLPENITALTGIESSEYSALFKNNRFLKVLEKESMIFEGGIPQYQVLATIDYDGIAAFIEELKKENPAFVDDDSFDVEQIKDLFENKLVIRLWIGVFDGKAKKIELSYQDQIDGTSVVMKSTIGLSNKTDSTAIEVPSVSYEIADFTEKARSGLIPDLSIDGVPYTEYLEGGVDMVFEEEISEEEMIVSGHRAFLNKIVADDVSSSYFLGNRRSFVGICKTFSLENDRTCREGRNGFIVYAQILPTIEGAPQYACVDAYTKGEFITLSKTPTALRCN